MPRLERLPNGSYVKVPDEATLLVLSRLAQEKADRESSIASIESRLEAVESKVSGGSIEAGIIEHINNFLNPHATTHDQVNPLLYTPNSSDNSALKHIRDIDAKTWNDHVARTDNPHLVTASQVGAVTSVDGVSNAGGNIDLVAANSITITPNNTNKTITIGESHSARTDNPHSTTAAQVGALALTGGTITGPLTINTSTDNKLVLKSGDADNKSYIEAQSSAGSSLSKLGYDGSKWVIDSYTIWHSGNDSALMKTGSNTGTTGTLYIADKYLLRDTSDWLEVVDKTTSTNFRRLKVLDLYATNSVQIAGSYMLVNDAGKLTLKDGSGTALASLKVQNLEVVGTQTTNNQELLNVAALELTLRAGYSGTPASTDNAYLKVERGTLTDAVIKWDENDDKWKAGLYGSEAEILTSSHKTDPSGHSTATTSAAGFMSAADKAKLDGIQSGAEVNQNAYSNITDGTNTASAGSKTDTFKLRSANNLLTITVTNNDATHGDNALFTVNQANIDHGSISGNADDDHTQYVHVSTARTITARHTFNPSTVGAPFTIGANASGQLVTGLNAEYVGGKKVSDLALATHNHPNATSSVDGFMSASDKAKLDSIQSGAEVNQNAYSSIKVGSSTISAASKTDQFEIITANSITAQITSGKIQIGESHSTRTDNPHSTTAAQVGAVSKSGDTMSGMLTVIPASGDEYISLKANSTSSRHGIYWKNTSGATVARIQYGGQSGLTVNDAPLMHEGYIMSYRDISVCPYSTASTGISFQSDANTGYGTAVVCDATVSGSAAATFFTYTDSNLRPMEYEVVVRASTNDLTTANQATITFQQKNGTQFETIATYNINGSDFTEANKYQQLYFSLPYTIKNQMQMTIRWNRVTSTNVMKFDCVIIRPKPGPARAVWG